LLVFLSGWSNTYATARDVERFLHTPNEAGTVGAAILDELLESGRGQVTDAEAASSTPRPAPATWSCRPPRDGRPAHIPLHFQMDLYAISDRIDWSRAADAGPRLDVRWARP
jgi:hypothetical protein